jgi:CHASE2 domain-containing sensor protein/two-component sensor histidine kinase
MTPWSEIRAEFTLWKAGALPGLIVLATILLARCTGNLQTLELKTLDQLLHLQPSEPPDQRILLIGINATDIENIKTYPIPDRTLASLIQQIQTHRPRAIGVDIIRDIPVQPGHQELSQIFQRSSNVFGVEIFKHPALKPSPSLPLSRIGFVDVPLDSDNHTRRVWLGAWRSPAKKDYLFSLPLRLAETYLNHMGFELTEGKRDRNAMQFGTVELPYIQSTTGSYIKTDDSGVQLLLNLRRGPSPFRTLSLQDIETGKFQPDWIRDHIVLIGITDPGVKDFFETSLGRIQGVELLAHTTSQLLSTVLDRRPALVTWSDPWEYLWIMGWGLIAIALGRLTQSALKNLFVTSLFILFLLVTSYLCLLWGWWIPLVPPLLLLVLNSVGLSAFAFYQHDRALKNQLQAQQHTIEQTFNIIHNGPLQSLGNLLRRLQDQSLPQDYLLEQLQQLNQEIRQLSDYLKQESLAHENSLRLGSGQVIDLQHPLHELLGEVYSSTLSRNLPHFLTITIKIRSFEPLEHQTLSIEQKRNLCQFLEEALCNIGKHAKNVSRIRATGLNRDGWYILSIQDNGAASEVVASEGYGTQQFYNLARQLHGTFKRESLSHQGTYCEFAWKIKSPSNIFPRINAVITRILGNRQNISS